MSMLKPYSVAAFCLLAIMPRVVASQELGPEEAAVKRFYDYGMRRDRRAYDTACRSFMNEIQDNIRYGGHSIDTLVWMSSFEDYSGFSYRLLRRSADNTTARVQISGTMRDSRSQTHKAEDRIRRSGHRNEALVVFEDGEWRFCGLIR